MRTFTIHYQWCSALINIIIRSQCLIVLIFQRTSVNQQLARTTEWCLYKKRHNVIGNFSQTGPFQPRTCLIAMTYFMRRSPTTSRKIFWFTERFRIVITSIINCTIIWCVRALCLVVNRKMHPVIEHLTIFNKSHKLFLQIYQTIQIFNSLRYLCIVLFEVRYSPRQMWVFSQDIYFLILCIVANLSPITFLVFLNIKITVYFSIRKMHFYRLCLNIPFLIIISIFKPERNVIIYMIQNIN